MQRLDAEGCLHVPGRKTDVSDAQWVQPVETPHDRETALSRGPGIDVVHAVTHSVVEQDCYLAGRRGDCF
ncbi:hypothetical protein ACIPUD_38845 [Bradyrhizobium sp. CAR08]